MGGSSQNFKDCLSCGGQIDSAAAKCPFCRSVFARCPTCDLEILAGRRCQTCDKSKVGGAAKSAPAGPEAPPIYFHAEPLTLLVLLLIRACYVLAFLAAIVVAAGVTELGPATAFVRQHIPRLRVAWPVPWIAAVSSLILMGVQGSLIRRFRLGHTAIFGEYVEVKLGLGGLLLNILTTLFLFPLTAGVALPWLFARYRQTFYRNCVLRARGGSHIGFQGTGGGVLRCFLFSLLLMPFGVASGGLLFGLISWIWVKWEQSNLYFPDAKGQYRPVEFFGSAWGYLWRWMLSWILSVVTVGLYRPWAKIAEWRWIVAHTHLG